MFCDYISSFSFICITYKLAFNILDFDIFYQMKATEKFFPVVLLIMLHKLKGTQQKILKKKT